MDDVFERAKAERDSIDKKLDTFTRQISVLTERRVALDQFLTIYEQLSAAPPRERSSRTERILTIVTEILADGRPRSTKALANELSQRGIEIGGRNPRATLSWALSHSGKFQSSRKFGWSSRKEPLEPELTSLVNREPGVFVPAVEMKGD